MQVIRQALEEKHASSAIPWHSLDLAISIVILKACALNGSWAPSLVVIS